VAFITAAAYKTSRGIAGTDHDTRIGVYVDAVQAFVRDYCGRDPAAGFESATWTEYLDGTGTDVLLLREWPVASITSVKFRTSSTAFDDAEPASAYYIDPEGTNKGQLYRTGGLDVWSHRDHYGLVWPKGRRNVQVVYVGGYSTTPGDLAEACYTLIDAMYSTSLRDVVNAQTATLGIQNMMAKTEDERAATVRRLLHRWAGALVA
jgi:hypothetical protein